MVKCCFIQLENTLTFIFLNLFWNANGTTEKFLQTNKITEKTIK